MTVKDKLKQYKSYVKRIEDLEERINSLEATAKKMTQTISDMPKGAGKTKDDVYAMLVDVKTIYLQEIKNLTILKCEILNMIDSVQDETFKAILKMRYVNLMKWEEICCKMGYSWQYVHILHPKALEKLKDYPIG